MNNRILVTDSLFINTRHVKQLEAAGYEVERLDKPEASEAELVEAVRGKVGYILGGTEKVTRKVIDAADELKAIVFTGTGYTGFIPAHEYATQKGILIGATPHLNVNAVAEFGVAMSLILSRDVFGLVRGGPKTFASARSITEITIGILGLGHIGARYLSMIKGLGAKDIHYANRTSKEDLEKQYNLTYVTKEELFKKCDLVFVALGVEAGEHYVTAENINAMQRGSLLVTIADPILFDLDALYKRIKNRDIRAAFDENIHEERFRELPLDIWYTPNASCAFNTGQTIEDVSTNSVSTLINLLEKGTDKYHMNKK